MPDNNNKDQNATKDQNGKGALPAGTKAPDFNLKVTPDQYISLQELRGRPVVLVFYPEDWSPVCGDEIALYNELLPEFKKYNAEVLGISVDSAWSHQAYAKEHHIHFPLLSDFNPKGEVGRAYGVYREQDGTEARALFVINPDGVIDWSYVSPVAVNPGADEVLNALENMKNRKETHGQTQQTSQ